MIRDVVLWLAIADIVAAAALGLVIYVVGRRSGHPVPATTAVGLTVLFALPGVVVYGLAWAIGA
ncbi:MAG TPA: hypothetical protein VM597_14360 [Gemmataceae bacterium]|jgi:hypothetical protein|nr:hypothetical protein [Gemmataceae bacterium]